MNALDHIEGKMKKKFSLIPAIFLFLAGTSFESHRPRAQRSEVLAPDPKNGLRGPTIEGGLLLFPFDLASSCFLWESVGRFSKVKQSLDIHQIFNITWLLVFN